MKKPTSSKEPFTIPPYETLKEVDPATLKYFTQFPLSKPTINALKINGFTKPTDIQKMALKHALLGHDFVAEAATGSGKTLGFLVPMLEKLYTERITTLDGPAALILTPTRELARQICLVLKRLCSSFRFTILNIMGGKNSEFKRIEWNTVAGANIIVGTPGRFAQHVTQNPLLDMSNLRIVVLDEADRLLDATFRGDVDTIMTNITPERQTMLFSATQTNTISQLARLHMRDPVVLSTKKQSQSHMPENLFQSYAVVPLDRKLDTLWTFLQSHCKKKIIVFFSTQKQVRYTYELFHKLRPYFRMMELRGNMQQFKRFKVYDQFASIPTGSVLLATNVAERGLDFPAVDWVVQFDCPRELDDYVHRVGRTARIGNAGRAITFLMPSELGLLDLLRERGVELKEQKFTDAQVGHPVSGKAPALLAAIPELANTARLAFSAYLSDYALGAGAPGKQKVGIASIFDPSALPLAPFANSLGLPSIPEFPKRFAPWIPKISIPSDAVVFSRTPDVTVTRATEPTSGLGLIPSVDAGEEDGDDDGFLRRKPQYVSALAEKITLEQSESAAPKKLLDVTDSSSEASEAEVEKPAADARDTDVEAPKLPSRKRTRIQRAKSELRRNIRTHTKVLFDESGMPVLKTIGDVPVPPTEQPKPAESATEAVVATAAETSQRLDVERERQYLREVVDKQDRELWKARRKEQNRLKRKKLKEARLKLQQARSGVSLQAAGKDEDEEDEADDDEEEDEHSSDDSVDEVEEDPSDSDSDSAPKKRSKN